MATSATELLRATAKAAFWQSFDGYPSYMEGLAAQVSSDSDQETYPWLASAPAIREMKGGRVKTPVPEISYSIKNKKWENTVPIAYEIWKYGKLGAVQALLADLGAKARAYPDKLMATLMAGTDTTTYDSKAFFATDHADPGASYTTAQANILTDTSIATAASVTDLEMKSLINQGITQLYSFKDSSGDAFWPGNAPRFIVFVPVAERTVAQQVQRNELIGTGVSNELAGQFELRVCPDITGDALYVFNASSTHKPFIFQVAEGVTLEDDMGGDNEFNTKEVHFGSFGYWNIGYGDWRTGVKVTWS